jgi:hypothetical protein
MKLRRKTLSIVGITIAGLTGVLYATSSNILLGSLVKAEEQEATQVVNGVLNVFGQTADDFNLLTGRPGMIPTLLSKTATKNSLTQIWCQKVWPI